MIRFILFVMLFVLKIAQTNAQTDSIQSQSDTNMKVLTIVQSDAQTNLALSNFDLHSSIFTGIWLPTGSAKLLGNHPLFGFQVGFYHKKMTYNLTADFKWMASRNEYQVLRDANLETTKNFFGGYFGLDLSRELARFKKHQIDILAGIGFDGFDALESTTGSSAAGGENGRSINSLNINTGLGYKYFFKNKAYIGLQGKYNFVNYKNTGGTDLSGNNITISLLLGGFLNLKDNMSRQKQ